MPSTGHGLAHLLPSARGGGGGAVQFPGENHGTHRWGMALHQHLHPRKISASAARVGVRRS